MEWNRGELKAEGKERIQRNYGSCVLVSLIFGLITGVNIHVQIKDSGLDLWDSGILLVTGILAELLIFSVLRMGNSRFYVENHDYPAGPARILFGFQCGHYGNVVLVMFLRGLFVALWTLLLIIPGIVKAYEYRMVPYILAEQPDISSTDAFGISREMMTGEKWNAFLLDLSFIGWRFLSIFTCGLLSVFWVSPYQEATDAELYIVLRDKWIKGHSGQ